MLLLLRGPLLRVPLLNLVDLGLQLVHLSLQIALVLLQLHHLLLHVGLALLRHQRLPHTERHTTLVQRLIGRDRHANLVAHPEQQQTPLSTADRDLANQFVKAL